MTSSEQDKIIEALAVEHGDAKVLPLRGADAVLACGQAGDGDALSIGDRVHYKGSPGHGTIAGESGDAAYPHLVEWDDRPGRVGGDYAADELVRIPGEDDGRGKWWYVPADPAANPTDDPDYVPLRYAYEQEIADALEQDAVRELLSAAGLRP